jgi:hypothetical protein
LPWPKRYFYYHKIQISVTRRNIKISCIWRIRSLNGWTIIILSMGRALWWIVNYKKTLSNPPNNLRQHQHFAVLNTQRKVQNICVTNWKETFLARLCPSAIPEISCALSNPIVRCDRRSPLPVLILFKSSPTHYLIVGFQPTWRTFFKYLFFHLYMFQAISAHHQEGTIVSTHPLVQHTGNKIDWQGGCPACWSGGNWFGTAVPPCQSILFPVCCTRGCVDTIVPSWWWALIAW